MAAGRLAAASVAAMTVIVLAGCGSNHSADTSTIAVQEAKPVAPRSELDLPPGIPDRATGPAAAESRRVINAWLRALRHGDVKRAAHYFALPSKFQNVTPVLTVDSEQERIAINLALPCGAKAVAMGGAGAYTIVTFKLTKRPGGNCGTGVGGSARGAIRVQEGKMTEWYRLPDKPGGEPHAPPAPDGPVV
jgi:hypothetical protein